MGSGLPVFLLITCLQVLVIAAVTDSSDLSALNAVKSNWMNTPPSWIGSDPCGGGWEGIGCTGSRITYIILTGMGLSGTLAGDIGDFSELQTLDLSLNKGLTGILPSTIVNLKKLENLFLVDCSFNGPIPDGIGSLTRLVSLQSLKLVAGLTLATFLFVVVAVVFVYFRRKAEKNKCSDIEHTEEKDGDHGAETTEDLVTFQGGQDLTIADILDAPGEVIGKSNYGTLYKALMQRSNCVRLLRFLRPICTERVEDFGDVVELLGCIRHPNLVSLLGFYAGPRGEKLLVHPFFRRGNLSDFIRDGNSECHKWSVIYKISTGIAKGLDHLHAGLQNPVIHGNLKSKNILLDRNFQPCISDFGLHLLLNLTAGQEMLEASAAEGYKAPELIKMKEVTAETDIYSLGIILLELLSGKEPVSENLTADEDFYLPTFMRNAVLGRRIADLYHPDVLLSNNGVDSERPVTEERVLKYFQLAMACCSPSPSLRPSIKQVLWKLEEIGR